MKQQKFIAVLRRAVFMMALLTFSTSSFSQDSTSFNKTLRIGVLGDAVSWHIKSTLPLGQYLADKMAHLGYTGAEIKVTNNFDTLARWMESGQIDMVSDTAYVAIELERHHNGEIALRRWKRGVSEYRSLFISHADSSITGLDDLQGHRIAFEDRHSTSGFFIPISVLVSHGYQLRELSSTEDSVGPDEIGYIVTADYNNFTNELILASWVYQGLVDASAYSDNSTNISHQVPSSIESSIKTIFESRPFPRSLIVLRRDLPNNLKTTITDILRHAHTTPEGQRAIKLFEDTTQFDSLSEDNNLALDKARASLPVVREFM
uniref:phosphate/phosphite/phosphonate ABC transporter substrate-binding protein n=1 Tax=Thaumasiovibrio occultus TaxID=1891184 RepID=UPI00131D73B2|nr:phosphate/phosphite/phosphonate ABC transporter substrate-binding protein [Thaumasiovibrio occultus]